MRICPEPIGLIVVAAVLLASAMLPAFCAESGPLDGGLIEPGDPLPMPPRTTVPTTAAEAEPVQEAEDLPAPADPTVEPPPTSEVPLTPEGTEVPPPADVPPPAAATEWRPEPSEEEILIDADRVYYQGGATIGEGNVRVRYRNITVTSDTAEIDEDGIWAQFRGNVRLIYDEQETTADLIRLNFETEAWEIIGARTVLEPSFFERGVAEPIFVRADTVTGTGEEEEVDAFDGLVTSCDKDEPHYGLISDHIRVIGDDKVVLEEPRLRILGWTVFKLPWDLVLSQRSRNNRFFPELGQNSVEGFYAKLAYLYLTGSELNSYIRLHLTEKRGIGFGGDHYFRTGAHSGQASLFYQPDESALSGRLRHDWDVSSSLTSSLDASLQENSGYSGSTRSLAANLNLNHRARLSTTSLGIAHSSTDSTFSSSNRFTTNLNHRQRLGENASFDLRSTLRRSEYGGTTPSTEIFDANVQFTDRGSWYDWALAADKEWYLHDDAVRSYGLERLPEIVFNTDSQRLGDYNLFGFLPFRARVSAGHIIEYPDEKEIGFAAIRTDVGGQRSQITDNSTLTTSMTFDQAFYSDDSARWTLGGSLNLNTTYGANWYTQLSHRAATVAGFSPLRRDYAGVYDDTTISIVQQFPNRSRFELTGGFDFVDDRWRELRLRGWSMLSSRDRLETVAGYALHESLWRPLELRWTHAAPPNLYLALSTRYDIRESELNSADLEFDWQVTDRWRFQGLSRWTGYSDEFADLNLRLTRDLHCWLASLSYSMVNDEIRLNFGIKAFPFEDQDWTLGSGGARLGSYQQYYY